MKGRQRRNDDWFLVTSRHSRVDPPPVEPPVDPPHVPPPPPDDDPGKRAQYELDVAKAETARLKKEMEDIKKQLPSDEQRARYLELEAMHEKAEEDRKRKAGEFDAWRAQIENRHSKELDAERQNVANEAAKREATEKELKDTLIGLSFSGATEWFGPTGKTVLLPAVAQSYFGKHVDVEIVKGGPNGDQTRRVVVRDSRGTIIVDPKTGQPMLFEKAIGELIEAHPQRDHLLRGSGKTGSGSTGGGGGFNEKDLNKLKPSDFQDKKVRDRVRDSISQKGGLQIGPAFDRMNKESNSK